MKKFLGITLLALAPLVLVACGGGGGGTSNGSNDSGPSAPTGGGGTTPAATSYWTMDAYTYVNAGKSAQSTGTVNGNPLTVVTVSTAGDTSNGSYSGGALTLSFIGTAPGTYNIVPSQTALVSASPATNPIYIESTVGSAVATGSTMYTAASGQVSITVDSAGKYHFSSTAPLATAKAVDALGGVPGAPASMALVIHDAY